MKTFLLSLGAALAIGFGAVSASEPAEENFCENTGVLATNLSLAKTVGIPFLDMLANINSLELDPNSKDYITTLAFVVYFNKDFEGLHPIVVGEIISAQCRQEQEAL